MVHKNLAMSAALIFSCALINASESPASDSRVLKSIFGAKSTDKKRNKLEGTSFENTNRLKAVRDFIEDIDMKEAWEAVAKSTGGVAPTEEEVWAIVETAKTEILKKTFAASIAENRMPEREINSLVNGLTKALFEQKWKKENWETYTPQPLATSALESPKREPKTLSAVPSRMTPAKKVTNSPLSAQGKGVLYRIFGDITTHDNRKKLDETEFINSVEGLKNLKAFLRVMNANDIKAAWDEVKATLPENTEPTSEAVWNVMEESKTKQLKQKFEKPLAANKIKERELVWLVTTFTQRVFEKLWNDHVWATYVPQAEPTKVDDAAKGSDHSADLSKSVGADSGASSSGTQAPDLNKGKTQEPASPQQKSDVKKISPQPGIGSDASKDKETFLMKHRNTLLAAFVVTVATMWLYSKYKHVDTQHTAAAA